MFCPGLLGHVKPDVLDFLVFSSEGKKAGAWAGIPTRIGGALAPFGPSPGPSPGVGNVDFGSLRNSL